METVRVSRNKCLIRGGRGGDGCLVCNICRVEPVFLFLSHEMFEISDCMMHVAALCPAAFLDRCLFGKGCSVRRIVYREPVWVIHQQSMHFVRLFGDRAWTFYCGQNPLFCGLFSL